MISHTESRASVDEALEEWIQAGQCLLDTLFSHSQEKARTEIPAEIIRQFLNIPVNQTALKNFHNHSILLLSSLQKISTEGVEAPISINETNESALQNPFDKKQEGRGAVSQANKSSLDDYHKLNGSQKLLTDRASNPSGKSCDAPLDENSLQKKTSQAPKKLSSSQFRSFTLQMTQKFLQEVVSSLRLLNAASTQSVKLDIRQVQAIYSKITAFMQLDLGLVSKGEISQRFIQDVKAESKKSEEKDNLLSINERPVLEKKLNNPQLKPALLKQDGALEFKSFSKIHSSNQNHSAFSNKNHHLPTPHQYSERMSISAAPFTPFTSSSHTSRKKEKTHKSFWFFKEHHQDDPLDRE